MSNDIFKKACLVQLATSCWTGAKDIKQSLMGNLGNTEWLKGKKLLVNPEVLSPLKATIQMARKLLQRYALPFPISGLHLVPKESIDEIDNRLEMFQSDFMNKVSSFAEFYAEAREEAKTALGELFNDTDYPQDIRTKFKFEWRFLLLDVPTKATFLSPETYQREKEKFQDLMAETRELAIAALREEFSEVITHLSDKVTGGDKPKILRSNMTNRVNEFLDGFSDRNLFDDEKLSALVNEAKTLVKTINGNPYAVQYNDVLRQKVTQDFSNLKTAIDAAIEEMPRRRIHLDAAADRGNLQEAA
ncbi:DUF3150 domain-containing protein [Fundidesulfovibrio terrae]|uniref:DUF3150 domain-containing protein n=1 Tax=Fundidesulfovibrio terrae TaxID=2922866 RepID=UPI001FAF6A12|nr:DUF3150 domain-containing protein [Fundidesulfovibrio terrae]